MEISVTINGTAQSHEVEARQLLVDYVRSTVGLTGTHIGCDTTSCGVCTVLLDGVPVKACTVLAAQADGHDVTTVEGLKADGPLHAVRTAFKENHGLPGGFCTPAMMLVGAALLESNEDPSEDDIRWAISGNLCRCTGYINIVKSIQAAAAERSAQ